MSHRSRIDGERDRRRPGRPRVIAAAAGLVAVEGAPLADIRALERPVLVVKGGRTVR